MSKNSIIPTSWRESFNELKEDIGRSVERWLGRLKPEERRKAEQELTLADFWQSPFDLALNQPRVNLDEDDDNIIVIAEIPGLRKEDLQIDLDGRQLTIHGQKEESIENKKKGRVHVSELRFGTFTRMLVLPCEVNREKVKAKYRRGILKLTMPKTEEAKARHIKIQYEE